MMRHRRIYDSRREETIDPPAVAGVDRNQYPLLLRSHWIPAFAGMTNGRGQVVSDLGRSVSEADRGVVASCQASL